MHYSVTFQTGIIPVVLDYATKFICINSQVSYSKILKEQSKTIQIIHQVFRTDTQTSASD